ncbi:ATP-grasp domain-containing protein [Candidatus Babeliales bacterium]|nr:ATP-grasp domain-containing protein [Candidatus Babeliales bacterium]
MLNNKKRILVLSHDSYENFLNVILGSIETYEFIIHTLGQIERFGIEDYVSTFLKKIENKELEIDGVIGCGENTCALAAIINHKIGAQAPALKSVLSCQNKFISRMKMLNSIPDNIPDFVLLSPDRVKKDFNFPLFVKPVRSRLSSFVGEVNSKKELRYFLRCAQKGVNTINKFYSELLKLGEFQHRYLDTHNNFLGESVLKGEQITVEGYVFNNKFKFFGIVHSLLMPNKISLYRFDYPYSFGEGLDKKIYYIVEKVLRGFELNNSSFNVELMVDSTKGDVFVIEAHSGLSLQFVSLIHNVTGYSPFEVACDLVVGKEPEFKKLNTKYNVASSCCLRQEKDCLVVGAPDSDKVKAIGSKYDNVTVQSLVDQGRRLSEYPQDSKTFRYAIINIPGKNLDEIKKTLDDIVQDLDYTFEPI